MPFGGVCGAGAGGGVGLRCVGGGVGLVLNRCLLSVYLVVVVSISSLALSVLAFFSRARSLRFSFCCSFLPIYLPTYTHSHRHVLLMILNLGFNPDH